MEAIWARQLVPVQRVVLDGQPIDADALLAAVEAAAADIVRHVHSQPPRRRPPGTDVGRTVDTRWGPALEEFLSAVDLFQDWFAGYLEEAGVEHAEDATRRVLTHLGARAVRVSREVILLLQEGYPYGAIARGRTLAETAIISMVIGSRGDTDVADRYERHAARDHLERMKRFAPYAALLGLTRHTDEELESATAHARDSDSGDYGWARGVVEGTPNLYTLRKAVRMDRLAPFIDLAHHHVHPTAHGVTDLDVMDSGSEPTLILGPIAEDIGMPLDYSFRAFKFVTAAVAVYGTDPQSVLQPGGQSIALAIGQMHDAAEEMLDAAELESPE